MSKTFLVCAMLAGLCFALNLHAQETTAPAALPEQPLTDLKEWDGFAYSRALFPHDYDPEFSIIEPLPIEAKLVASGRFHDRLASLRDALVYNEVAIRTILMDLAVDADRISINQQPLVIQISDSDTAVAASNGQTITLSAVTLRGFLIGAVEEGVNGESSDGLMLRLATGWRQGDQLSPGDWTSRVLDLLAIIEKTEDQTLTAEAQHNVNSMISNFLDEGVESPDRFLDLKQRILVEGKPVTAEEHFFLSIALFYLDNSLIQPAEAFLLAHELGHVVLGHQPGLDCVTSAKQERDADVFAITLLTYDGFVGGVDALFFSAYATRDDETAFAEYLADESLRYAKYGFVQAFRFGMARAGMQGSQTDTCPFMSGTERLQRAQQTWRQIVAARVDAVKELGAYQRTRPGMAWAQESATLLSDQEAVELLEQHRADCKGVPARLVRRPQALNPNQYIYVVRCVRPAPTADQFTQRSLRLAGRDFIAGVMALYSDTPDTVQVLPPV